MLTSSRVTVPVIVEPFETAGTCAESFLRVALALSGLLVAGLGQAHVGPYGRFAWFVLLLASIYSVALYGWARYRDDVQPRRLWHWIDAAWCAGVAVLTGGGGSAFTVLSVFPILSASLRWGSAEGMRVSTVIVALWAGAELFDVAGRGDWNAWGWMLTKALLLLAVAYVASQFIEFERHSRARLRLLADINQVPNARFGPDRVIGSALERLRDFYKADTCLAVISTTDSAPRILVAEEGRHGASLEGPKASALVENLLALPDSCGVACSAPRRVALARAGAYVEGTEGTEQREEVEKRSRELSQFLDAGSWLTVPLEQRGATMGRLYLMSRKERFGPSDIPFLRHVVDQLMPVVETVRLLDSLASEAAGKERRRISLDLHDSTIQPYLGLKLGLESLSRKADPANPLAAELEELCRVTNESIAELRRYVRDLKVRPPGDSGSLLEAAQHQANRFSGLYGMDVELNVSPPDLRLNDRLTAEVMQMVGESLSNIGRHTDSRRATINLSRRGQRFLAQIINHGGDPDTPWQSFRPESITQRATQLGGIAEVSGQADGGTAVTVEIPL